MPRSKYITLSGGLTLREDEFRIDDEVNDEIFISVKFYDDGLLVKAEKLAIGNKVLDFLKNN